MRLRMEHLTAGSMHVTIRYALTREQVRRRKRGKSQKALQRAAPLRLGDGGALSALPGHAHPARSAARHVGQAARGREFARPFFVGVTMHNLIAESDLQASLFADPDHRADLAATMDKLNLKYGHTTLHFAGMLPARQSAPTRISFTQIPVKYGVDYI